MTPRNPAPGATILCNATVTGQAADKKRLLRHSELVGFSSDSVFHNSWDISISLGYLTCFITSLTWYSVAPIFGVGLGLQPHQPPP